MRNDLEVINDQRSIGREISFEIWGDEVDLFIISRGAVYLKLFGKSITQSPINCFLGRSDTASGVLDEEFIYGEIFTGAKIAVHKYRDLGRKNPPFFLIIAHSALLDADFKFLGVAVAWKGTSSSSTRTMSFVVRPSTRAL